MTVQNPLRINLENKDRISSSNVSARNGTIGWSVWNTTKKEFNDLATSSKNKSLAGTKGSLYVTQR